jgi:hypothetical protein
MAGLGLAGHALIPLLGQACRDDRPFEAALSRQIRWFNNSKFRLAFTISERVKNLNLLKRNQNINLIDYLISWN